MSVDPAWAKPGEGPFPKRSRLKAFSPCTDQPSGNGACDQARTCKKGHAYLHRGSYHSQRQHRPDSRVPDLTNAWLVTLTVGFVSPGLADKFLAGRSCLYVSHRPPVPSSFIAIIQNVWLQPHTKLSRKRHVGGCTRASNMDAEMETKPKHLGCLHGWATAMLYSHSQFTIMPCKEALRRQRGKRRRLCLRAAAWAGPHGAAPEPNAQPKQ